MSKIERPQPQPPLTTPTTPNSDLMEPLECVVQAYTPHHQGELQLAAGDVVADTKPLGNGWSLGRNMNRDETGIFPSGCTRPLMPSERTPSQSDMESMDRGGSPVSVHVQPTSASRSCSVESEPRRFAEARHSMPRYVVKPHLAVKPCGSDSDHQMSPPVPRHGSCEVLEDRMSSRDTLNDNAVNECADGLCRRQPSTPTPSVTTSLKLPADICHGLHAVDTPANEIFERQMSDHFVRPPQMEGHYQIRTLPAENIAYTYTRERSRDGGNKHVSKSFVPCHHHHRPDDCYGQISTRGRQRRMESDYYEAYHSKPAVLGETQTKPAWRVLISIIIACLLGASIIVCTHYAFHYPLWVCLVAGGCVATLLGLMWSVSRLARCITAVWVLSTVTTRGRLALLLALSAFLMAGPVRDAGRGLACDVTSAGTVAGGTPAVNWQLVDSKLDNTRLQLRGVTKRCHTMMAGAHRDCVAGIQEAADKCTHFKGRLGEIYNKARDILEGINPDRIVTPPPPESPEGGGDRGRWRKRRQIQRDEVPSTDCETLNATIVCERLSDPVALCKPVQWADEAFLRAVNQSDPSWPGCGGAAAWHYEATIITLVCVLSVLGGVLLTHAAYLHVKRYVSSEYYDNAYITRNVVQLDRQASPPLLPLRPVEKRHLVETNYVELSRIEEPLYRVGLCVVFLHALLAGLCYVFATSIRCAPRPNVTITIVIVGCYILILITTLLKAYVLRIRSHVTAAFYPRAADRRARTLYAHLRSRRKQIATIAQRAALTNHRRRTALASVALCHQVAAHCAPWRVLAAYDGSRCLVCDAAEDATSHDCSTPQCGATYCAQCFVDLARVCALCRNGRQYATATRSPNDDYEEVEETQLIDPRPVAV